MRTLAANLILILHLCLVLFVVGGFVAVPLGARARWSCARHRGFRSVHCIAMTLVAAETLLGIMCPLTVWEDALRGAGTEGGFVERLLHRLIFFDLPHWVFAAGYVGGLVLAMALWRWVPPRPRRKRR